MNLGLSQNEVFGNGLSHSQETNVRFFQIERVGGQLFNFDEKGRKFFKWLKNSGKRRNYL